jgi:hypothetical protein
MTIVSSMDAVAVNADPVPAIRNKTRPDWGQVLGQNMRFYWNKARYGLFLMRRPGRGSQGLVQQARVVMRDGAGWLPYWAIRDTYGLWRGGHPPWIYLQELASATTERTKLAIVRRLLAQLPARVSFPFVFNPQFSHSAPIRAAFGHAGFNLLEVETYVCAPPAGPGEMIDRLTGKSIKGTLRRARRDLDLVEITVADYLRFDQMNLVARGKKNYRDINADRILLEEALKHGRARLLATRRKATPANPGPFPADAAMACLWDDKDGTYKIWRLTHRLRNGTEMAGMPNPDASKLLILAALEDAAARGMMLETDGSTPGLTRLYSTFGPGIFNRTMRLHCERHTLWSVVNKYYPFLFRAIARWTVCGWSAPQVPSAASTSSALML